MTDTRPSLRERLSRATRTVTSALFPARASATDAEIADRARDLAPVVWLLGKVQSGKSSIVRVLTQSTAAEVGNGFKPCTCTARIFEFPPEAPLVRFLDTRGLGEAGYDPSEDLAVCEAQAHTIIVTMRALDQQQDAVIHAVRAIRRRHPGWPILVAQTTLHEGYRAGAGHILPYPFKDDDPAALTRAGASADLVRSLTNQRALFADIPGRGPIAFVPIDFTLPEDGFEPVAYGYDALADALQELAPTAVSALLRNLHGDSADEMAARAHPHILGYATAAAAADIWPIAGVALVPAIQAKLIHAVGAIYDVTWNRRTLSEFAGALGATTLLRVAGGFGARELAKLVPLYGQTAGAAAAAVMSFATTYALGKAACYFLERRKAGTSDPAGVAQTYKTALAAALRLARERDLSKSSQRNTE